MEKLFTGIFETRLGEFEYYELLNIHELMILIINALNESEEKYSMTIQELKRFGLKFTKNRIGRLGKDGEITIKDGEKIKYGFHYEEEGIRGSKPKILYMKYFLEVAINEDRFKRAILYFEYFKQGRNHGWEISGDLFYSTKSMKFIFPAKEYD